MTQVWVFHTSVPVIPGTFGSGSAGGAKVSVLSRNGRPRKGKRRFLGGAGSGKGSQKAAAMTVAGEVSLGFRDPSHQLQADHVLHQDPELT